MTELIEETPAPEVLVRHAASTRVEIRPGDDGQPPLVGVGQGAVWARAEPEGPGVDIGHGALNVVVRSGTALFDARGGAGLVIVLRGEVEIVSAGVGAGTARAGEAITFDASGQVSDPDPIDAAEVALDTFVSLNLVLDALAGVPLRLVPLAPEPVGPRGARPDGGAAPGPGGGPDPERKKRILRGRGKR